MLNAATISSFLLLPFDNAKLSTEGRSMHIMQDGEKKIKQEHGKVSGKYKRS